MDLQLAGNSLSIMVLLRMLLLDSIRQKRASLEISRFEVNLLYMCKLISAMALLSSSSALYAPFCSHLLSEL